MEAEAEAPSRAYAFVFSLTCPAWLPLPSPRRRTTTVALRSRTMGVCASRSRSLSLSCVWLLLAFSLVDGPATLPDTTLLDVDADSPTTRWPTPGRLPPTALLYTSPGVVCGTVVEAEVLIARGRWEAEGAGDSGVVS